MNDHQQLEQAMKDSRFLTKDQKGELWKLLNGEGMGSALYRLSVLERENEETRGLDALNDDVIPYKIWGRDHIDPKAIDQMDLSMRLPVSVAGALMPDAHVGYGLPIGGVLATDNTIIPYAVGVDISCQIRLSVYPVSEETIFRNPTRQQSLAAILLDNTAFGVGVVDRWKSEHAALEDKRWLNTSILRQLHGTGYAQLGTSGGGNHFVEWGIVHLGLLSGLHTSDIQDGGGYLALMSHSGSRGVGARLADYYTKMAQDVHPYIDESVKRLAWLDLDSAEGQEYWEAMEVAGIFADANHDIIHQRISKALGVQPSITVGNKHNFAWRETLQDGTSVIVHRKGATPAGAGQLGIIPASMGDSGFLVRGKGNPESIQSASHGSGRAMSRNQAKQTITPRMMKDWLKEHNVKLLGGGLDEAPQAYKRIGDVMPAQADLVEIIGRFDPRIVRMSDDGQSED